MDLILSRHFSHIPLRKRLCFKGFVAGLQYGQCVPTPAQLCLCVKDGYGLQILDEQHRRIGRVPKDLFQLDVPDQWVIICEIVSQPTAVSVQCLYHLFESVDRNPFPNVQSLSHALPSVQPVMPGLQAVPVTYTHSWIQSSGPEPMMQD